VRVIELCAGLGGSRSGLHAEGWETILAVDSSPDAVMAHRATFGDAAEADVWDLDPDDLPAFDVLSAGFPCQPFSSSGHRSGFHHESGNVFEGIVRILEKRRPATVVLENVYGLLHNKGGHTFSRVLQDLTALGYAVDWLTVDLRWFGYPQTRPRVLMLAVQDPKESTIPDMAKLSSTSAFAPVLARLRLRIEKARKGSVADIEASRRPAIGKPAYRGVMPFGAGGFARGDEFASFRLKATTGGELVETLGKVVAPDFASPEEIRSARYWAYDGPSSLHLRDEPISHCVGTSLGGAPLYAVRGPLANQTRDLDAFLRFSNWSRSDSGFVVMRLQPSRAVRLFGDHTEVLERGLRKIKLGSAKKYVLVGNMMAPAMAQLMVRLVEGRSIDTLIPERPVSPTMTLF
jgi:C-5 cytosine-specific DNA methylase